MKPIKDGHLERVELGATFDHDPSGPLPDDLEGLRGEYGSLGDEVQKIKHIYAIAGLALYAAQCFEMELQQVILSVKKAKGELTNPEDYDALDGNLTKVTLGNLLREVSSVVAVNEKGLNLLAKALDARNSLAHGFFQVHAEDFMTDAGRYRMLGDLLQRILLFRMADNLAGLVTKAILKAFGVNESDVDALFEKLRADLRNRQI